jgi:glutamate--cysteine ligase
MAGSRGWAPCPTTSRCSTTIELPGGGSSGAGAADPHQATPGLKHSLHHPTNNDLSAGVPGIVEDLHEVHLVAPLHGGWPTRRKATTSPTEEVLSKRFGKLLGRMHSLAHQPDVKPVRPTSAPVPALECLRSNTDCRARDPRTRNKGINEKPFVVIKADNGTGGIAS